MGLEGFSRSQKSSGPESTPQEPTLEEIAAEMQRRTNELADGAQVVSEESIVTENLLNDPGYADIGLRTPEQQEGLRKALESLGKIDAK